MNTNTTPTTARKGSGRTKGSYSFVTLSLADLNAKLINPDTKVMVGRKFAEQHGFTGMTCAPASSAYGKIAGSTPATKVAAVVTDLDAGDSKSPSVATPSITEPAPTAESTGEPAPVATVTSLD